MVTVSRVFLIALPAAIAGCGGSNPAPTSKTAAAPQTGLGQNALGLIREVGAGPNVDQIQQRVLENVTTTCRFQQDNPDAGGEMGRVTDVRETSRKTEKVGDTGTDVMMEYEARIEFTVMCDYQSAGRKPGDKLAVYGEAEWVNDGGQWNMLPLSIRAR